MPINISPPFSRDFLGDPHADLTDGRKQRLLNDVHESIRHRLFLSQKRGPDSFAPEEVQTWRRPQMEPSEPISFVSAVVQLNESSLALGPSVQLWKVSTGPWCVGISGSLEKQRSECDC